MNRIITFRGLRRDRKGWVYGNLIRISRDGKIDCNEFHFGIQVFENGTFKGVHIILRESVGQFIGLIDNNGYPVYEGDIVKDRFDRIMRIGIWNYRLCFIAISETNFHHADFYDWLHKGRDMAFDETLPAIEMDVEIIGNIHDNPELL